MRRRRRRREGRPDSNQRLAAEFGAWVEGPGSVERAAPKAVLPSLTGLAEGETREKTNADSTPVTPNKSAIDNWRSRLDGGFGGAVTPMLCGASLPEEGR